MFILLIPNYQTTMNKEEIYDEKINPLMAQIVDICKEAGIAAFCTFAIPTEEDDGLRCTTHLQDSGGNYDEPCRLACAAVMNGTRRVAPLMMTTEHADGSKTLTAILG